MTSSAVDTIGTSDLMAWFDMSKRMVGYHLDKAGVEPQGRGPHGENVYPRIEALEALETRRTRTPKGVVLP